MHTRSRSTADRAASRVAVLLALLSGLAVTTPLAAQDTAATVRPAAEREFCWRGRALPRCQRFLITEVGYYRRLAGSRFTVEDPNGQFPSRTEIFDRDHHFSWELGLMENLDARNAVGGTLLVGTGTNGARVGLKGRYRRWMGDGSGRLDLSAGGLRGGMNQRIAMQNPGSPTVDYYIGTVPAYGVTADATFDVGDVIGVSTRVELMRARGGRTGSAVYGGVRIGSYGAVAASAVAGAGLIYLIYALSKGDF